MANPLIIVKIFGGLGNQLFQYAAARALSLRSNATLKLDITDSLIKDDRQRIYGLHHFNIKENIATSEEIENLLSRNRWLQKRSKYLQNKIGIALHKTWWNQTYVYQSQYDRAIMGSVTRDVYLNGYWQKEEFFKQYRPLLLEELSVKAKPDPVNSSLIEKMSKVNAVSLHVRRGDAVTNAVSVKIYKLPSLGYYQQAINMIRDKVSNPHLFIFSDDIPWCRENLDTGLPMEFIDHNGDDRNYEDIRLMSHCKHHITANSTFSWWGAWLNPSADKLIITPEKWFHVEKLNGAGIVPGDWIKI
jgi:hypothetical protein